MALTFRLPFDQSYVGRVFNPVGVDGVTVTYLSYNRDSVTIDVNGTPVVLSRGTHEVDGYTFVVTNVDRNGVTFTVSGETGMSYALGSDFEISLDQNLSTGYSWTFETSAGLMIVKEENITQCPPGVVGCGGKKIVTLRGTRRGSQTFKGEYGRSWEPSPVNTKIYNITIY